MNLPRATSVWPKKIRLGSVTVKVYRVCIKGQTCYQVADYSSGRRRLRTFTQEAAALEQARQLARTLSAGQTQAASLSAQEIAVYARLRELVRPTGLPLEVVVSQFLEAHQLLGGDSLFDAVHFYLQHRPAQVVPVTVSAAVAEYLKLKEGQQRSLRHVRDLRSRLGRFAQAHACEVSHITTAMVQRWLNALAVSEQTRKNYRTILHGFFRYCERLQYLPKGGNPVPDTERPRVRRPQLEIYEPAELAALLKAARADFLPVLALGAFAGLRTAELTRLQWENIEAEYIRVDVHQAKTASQRLVPLLPNLRAWLAPYAGRTGLIWQGTADQLCDAQTRTARAARVSWKVNGLRHSFISYRLALVRNAAQVAMEAGHSSPVLYQHYVKPVPQTKAEAWFALTP